MKWLCIIIMINVLRIGKFSKLKIDRIDSSPVDFFFLLGLHIWFIFQGITNTLNDLHAFRQTQTAITAYYFSEEGFKFDYLTPTLGYPWSIPFEFPIYQWVVSFLHSSLALDLDVSGRLVSILAMYCMLFVIYLGFNSFGLSRSNRFVILSVMLFNPILLFWSRTFMIETTALLFSIAFLFALIKFSVLAWKDQQINYLWLFIASFFGVLAALTKVTTFMVYFFCAGLCFIHLWYLNRDRLKVTFILKIASIAGFFAFFIPLVSAYLWTMYTDSVKQLSFLGEKVTSANLQAWNFGSLESKFSWTTWTMIDYNSCHMLFMSILVSLVSVVLGLKHRFHMLIFTLSGALGPVLFTNLYLVHDYYSVANVALFSLTLGLFSVDIISRQRGNPVVFILGTCFMIFFLLSSMSEYYKRYRDVQVNNNPTMKMICNEIKLKTKKQDVLLVLGKDWSSEIPYYSERRAVCVPNWMLVQLDANPKQFLDKLKSSRISALVTIEGRMYEDQATLKLIELLGLSKTPVNIGGYCMLYIK